MNRLRRLISVLLAALMLFGMVSGAIAQSVWGGETEHTHAEHTHAEHTHDEQMNDEHTHDGHVYDEHTHDQHANDENAHAGGLPHAEEPRGEYEPHYDPDSEAVFEPVAEDLPTRADNTTWSFDEDTGTLTISGTGAIQNYSSNNQPWKDYKDRITSLVIEEGVEGIGNYAFSGCSSLSNIELPEGLTTIYAYAFQNCNSLTVIHLPDSITAISSRAFYNCAGLVEVNYPAGWVSTLDYNYGTSDSYDQYCCSPFAGCANLATIVFPHGMTTIARYAFYNCTGIQHLDLPDDLPNISYKAFNGCSSLVEIELPNSLTNMSSYVFANCTGMVRAKVNAGRQNIVDGTFFGCSSLSEVELPDSVTAIKNYAFSGCSSLSNIELPEGLTTIYAYAFQNCNSLTVIHLPDSITAISSRAFYNCTGLVEVNYPAGWVSTLDYNYGTSDSYDQYCCSPFAGCANLATIVFPHGMTTIARYAFYNCTGLTSIEIPISVTTINNYAFSGCTSLTDVYFASTEEVWEAINIGTNNEPLLNATMHYEHVHTFGDYVIVSEPTCTMPGSKYRVCSSCGYVRYESIPMIEHTPGERVVDIEPTCTGYGESSCHCTMCGKRLEIIRIESLGHLPGEWVIDIEPTCTASGKKSHYCERCGARMDITTIPPLGHDFGEWIIDKEATVLEEGSMHHTCSRCEYAETQTIDRIEVNIDEDPGYGRITVTVKDATTLEVISGASVFVSAEGEGERTFFTDANGRTTITLPVGRQSLAVYKQGYNVRNIGITVRNEEYELPVIGISTSEIVGGEVTVTEMTYEEIVAAGIDVTAPGNNHVYQYEVQISFNAGVDWESIVYYFNGTGDLILPGQDVGPMITPTPDPDTGGTGASPTPTPKPLIIDVGPDGDLNIEGGNGGGWYWGIPFSYGDDSGTIYPIGEEFYLIFHGEAKWLKEMFDVELLVLNNSNTDTIEDCVAALHIPEGLSLADMAYGMQTYEQYIGHVDEGGSKSVHWYVRGDDAGSYDVSVDLSGMIMPFEEEFTRTYVAKDPIKVSAGNAMHLTFEIPDAAYHGEDYTVRITLENVSDKPIYNVSHRIYDVTQTQITYYSDGTQETITYQADGEITVFRAQFNPGDKLIIEFTTNTIFDSELVKYQLEQICEKILGAMRLYDGFCSALNLTQQLSNTATGMVSFISNFGNMDFDSPFPIENTHQGAIQALKDIKTTFELFKSYMNKSDANKVELLSMIASATEYQEFVACLNSTDTTAEFVEEFEKLNYNNIKEFFSAVASYIRNKGDAPTQTFDKYEAVKTAISMIPIRYSVQDVLVTTMEGSTTEIPYSIEFSHIGPRYFGVDNIGKFFYDLAIVAMGKVNVPGSLLLFGAPEDPTGYEAALQRVNAVLNNAAAFAAQDSTGETTFSAWVELADGTIITRSGGLCTLEVEDNDTVTEANGVLTFTGDGLIKVTPHEVGLEAVLHVRMTNGGEVKEKEYAITSVPQHECCAGHREILIPATETEAAYAALCCDVCGEIVGFDRVPFCSEHSFGEWQHTLDSACDHVGFNERTCSVCGYVEREQIAALPHSCGEWTVIAEPTCSCVGCRVSHCSICDSDVYEEIPMLPHTEGEWEFEVWPTSGEGGVRVKHCEVCGAELEREEVPPLGPDYICTVSYYVDGELYATRQVLIDNMLDSAPDLPYRYMCRSWWDVDYTRTPVPHDVRVDAVFVQLEAGDTNNDGEFSFEDVTILSSYLTGAAMLNENGLYCADFNRDGDIDFSDLTALYRYFLFG